MAVGNTLLCVQNMKKYDIKADGHELATSVDFETMMGIVNFEKQNHTEINVTESHS